MANRWLFIVLLLSSISCWEKIDISSMVEGETSNATFSVCGVEVNNVYSITSLSERIINIDMCKNKDSQMSLYVFSDDNTINHCKRYSPVSFCNNSLAKYEIPSQENDSLLIAIKSYTTEQQKFSLRVAEKEFSVAPRFEILNLFMEDGNDCDFAIPIVKDTLYFGNNSQSAFSINTLKYPSCGPAVGRAVFYSYTTQSNRQALVITTCFGQTTYDTVLSVYNGTCNSLSCLATDDNNCYLGKASTITLEGNNALPAGTRILIAVSGKNSVDIGNFVLTVTEGTTNDICEDAITVSNFETVSGNTLTTVNSIDSLGYPTNCTSNTNTETLFYRYTVQRNDTYIVMSTLFSYITYDTHITLYSGPCGSLTCRSRNDDYSFYQSALVVRNYPVGMSFLIAVHGYDWGDEERAGIFSLFVGEFPTNSTCSNALFVQNGVKSFGIVGENMNTPLQLGLPTLSGADPQKAIAFFRYTTLSSNVKITIDTCVILSSYSGDSFVDVYTGPCGNLQVVAGGTCYVTLDPIYPSGTTFTIAKQVDYYNGYDFYPYAGPQYSYSALFEVLVTENSEYPSPGFDCNTAPFVQNDIPVYGTTTGAPNTLNNLSPVVYYKYQALLDFGSIRVTTCISEFNMQLSFYTLPCSNLTFLGSGTNCYYWLNQYDDDDYFEGGVPQGTIILIAVEGRFDTEEGEFQLHIMEEENRYPEKLSSCETALPIQNNVITHGNNFDFNFLSVLGYPSCTVEDYGNHSIVFYQYTLQYDYGTVYIDSCNSRRDNILSVYVNSCANLACWDHDYIYYQNSDCGILMEGITALPRNTRLLIGYQTIDQYYTGPFELHLREYIPPSPQCASAYGALNHQTILGQTTNAMMTLQSLSYPSCGAIGVNSPVQFVRYTALYTKGRITFSLCGPATNFDAALSVYSGSCGSLQCLSSGYRNCGTKSQVVLTSVNAGTQLLIAIRGSSANITGQFSLSVTELRPEPTNGICSNAIQLSNNQLVVAYSENSPTTASSLPPCGVAHDAGVVFYKYTTQYPNSPLSISTCNPLTNFDTFISLFRGTCGSLVCVKAVDDSPGCGLSSNLQLNGTETLPMGTPLIIAVHGYNRAFGDFQLRLVETLVCSNEPVILCSNSISITANHSCALGAQCATIPPLNLGSCYDSSPNCGCRVSQLSGPTPGQEVLAGSYTVQSVGTNDYLSQSRICSFSINVQNQCKATGPSMTCPVQSLTYTTSLNCQTDTGESCVVLPPTLFGSCSEFPGCTCTTFQSSGPRIGDKLVPGQYTIVFSASSSVGINASSPCVIEIQVLANSFTKSASKSAQASLSPSLIVSVTPSISESRTPSVTPPKSLVFTAAASVEIASLSKSKSAKSSKIPTLVPSKSPLVFATSATDNCNNCQTGGVQINIGSSGSSPSSNINLQTDSGATVGSIVIPTNLVPEGFTGMLDISFSDSSTDRGETGNVIVDITLRDDLGNPITTLPEPVRICLEESSQSGDKCLGYYDEQKREWVCEDECLEKEGSSYCGETSHLTSFALLLSGDGGGDDPCGSSEDYTLAWISLALVSFAILLIVISVVAIEIRMQIKKKQTNARMNHLTTKVVD